MQHFLLSIFALLLIFNVGCQALQCYTCEPSSCSSSFNSTLSEAVVSECNDGIAYCLKIEAKLDETLVQRRLCSTHKSRHVDVSTMRLGAAEAAIHSCNTDLCNHGHNQDNNKLVFLISSLVTVLWACPKGQYC